MDNVIHISERKPEQSVDIEIPLALVNSQFRAGVLSRHAFFLGAIMVSHFQVNNRYSGALTRQDVYSTYTVLDGEPFAGPVDCELEQFAHALQALQAHCGLYSNVTERVSKLRDRFTHFTEASRRSVELHKLIKQDTPIYFEYRPEEQAELITYAEENIKHHMLVSKFAHISMRK